MADTFTIPSGASALIAATVVDDTTDIGPFTATWAVRVDGAIILTGTLILPGGQSDAGQVVYSTPGTHTLTYDDVGLGAGTTCYNVTVLVFTPR